ncbi:MAG TPA: ABC transporter ATP-binding protein [Anaerolineales bacterium]|nr:ABC transporter ATP-binding protein [Anaerolineales bacterium]
MEYLIEARNLSKHFGQKIAVDNLGLQVASGEIYGLVGPDGAGKTTTMRLLCGALRTDLHPQDGMAVVQIGGYDVIRQTEHARAQIGYLPQRFSLYEELTVLENIRFFAEVRGLPPSEWQPRCMEILKFVGLDTFTSRRAGHLSGGMKQKLGLAAALVHRPRILLLDEPTTGVDPVTRQDFWQLIIRLVYQGKGERVAALVSTPYMDEAARCTRVGFMQAGSLVLEGTPAGLRERLVGRVLEVRGQPLSLLRKLAETIPGVEGVQLFGDRLHVRVGEGQASLVSSLLEAGASEEQITLLQVRQNQPQLEDVFISLLEG